jgi:hypothetical protein
MLYLLIVRACKIGNRFLIDRADLDRFIDARLRERACESMRIPAHDFNPTPQFAGSGSCYTMDGTTPATKFQSHPAFGGEWQSRGCSRCTYRPPILVSPAFARNWNNKCPIPVVVDKFQLNPASGQGPAASLRWVNPRTTGSFNFTPPDARIQRTFPAE